MPEKSKFTVAYSPQSLENAISIKNYLINRFSNTEVDSFFKILQTFEQAVSLFPKLYPQTKHSSKVRRAVLSKELSVFYRVNKTQIEVLAIFDNRCNFETWL